MTTWRGQTRGGLIGHKIFVLILKYLGLEVAYFILRFVALYYLFFSRASTKTTYAFYRKVLKYPPLKSWRMVYKNYYVFGQTLIDKVAVIGGLGDRFSVDHDGQVHLREVVSKGTGGLFISAHIGNYEIAGHLLKQINAPAINIVMYDAEHQKIKSFYSEIYGDRPVNIIPVKDDLSHIFEINNAIKRSEVVCIHGDRFVSGSKVVKCKFFGEEANFPLGPFIIANKLRIPYSYVFALKEKKYHYHFYATPSKVSETTPEEMVKEYVASVEKMVLEYPEQWFNYYDFWTAKP